MQHRFLEQIKQKYSSDLGTYPNDSSFLQASIEQALCTQPRHKFAYVPFGGGPHLCAGNHLALVEGLITLVMIAQRYDVRFADSAYHPQVQALALTTMKELPMVFEAR